MADLRAICATTEGTQPVVVQALASRSAGPRSLLITLCCSTLLVGSALTAFGQAPEALPPSGDKPRPRIIDNPGSINAPRKTNAPRKGDGPMPGPGQASERDGPRRPEVPIEKLIEVAEDIEPGWAKSLRERLETDREATIRAIRQNGGRFVGLVMLKERNRGFYEMKVKELQGQIEARKIAQQYHEAHGSGREDDCDRALERMREVCQRVVDLQLWQRASELNSLEVLVKEQRDSLERDAKPAGRRTLIEQLMKEMTAGRPALGLFEIIERRSRDRAPLQPVVSESDQVPPPPPGGPGAGPPPGPPPAAPPATLADAPAGPAMREPGSGPREPRMRDIPIERFIEVARDISPDAAALLQSDLEKDREGTIKSIRQGGPRYFGLVVLKDRDPELYQLKVKELSLHLALRSDAQRFHDAIAADLDSDAQAATARMTSACTEIVDLQIQQRGREVTTLIAMIDEERAALARDSRAEVTADRRDRMIDDLMHSPPGPALSDLLEQRGRRHDREGGRGGPPSVADPTDALPVAAPAGSAPAQKP